MVLEDPPVSAGLLAHLAGHLGVVVGVVPVLEGKGDRRE